MGIWQAMLLMAKMLAESVHGVTAMGARLASTGLTCRRVGTTRAICNKLRLTAPNMQTMI